MKIEIIRIDVLPPAKPAATTLVERCRTPDGVVHTGPGCIYAAARHMIGRGVNPRTRVRVMRDDKPCLSGRLEVFAKKSWGGTTRDPFSRPWQPYPGELLPPALAAWWESQQ